METIDFKECKLVVRIYDSFITTKGAESITKKNGSIFSFLTSISTQGNHEKRYIQISISKPFEIGKLPPHRYDDDIII